jgi:alpha-amylase
MARSVRRLILTIAMAFVPGASPAVDASSPAVLQWFDSSYVTQRERVADFFLAGYGSTWIPPVGRADSGGQSVGYDVFDRFDLGSPTSHTLYGTEQGLRNFTSMMHQAGGSVVVDLIWNHNGFSDATRTNFVAEGGYPGFVLTAPGLVDGDFHGRFEGGDLNGRLSGLIDIKHEVNLQYIRTPVNPADSRNIPAGTIWNRPDPANARFYPDRNQPGTTAFNPLTGQTVTLYDFNTADPMAGDAVPENATGVLMRSTRWLVNDVGVDGFRLDAARHFEPWVFGYFDQSVYGASRRRMLDGSPYQVFSFSEAALTDRNTLLNQFVRKDVGRLPAGQITGNRDALDFAQFWPVKQNLTSNGAVNDFRSMAYAGMDFHDDGLINGSSGVVFVQSHDDFGPDMMNVAYAFSLMRPGNAVVYYNAYEHYSEFRDFPKPGRGDALGNFGDAITTLVDLRNRYGRGDYRERWLEKENFAFERSGASLVMLSNRNDAGYDSRTMAVDFTLGSRLVELTGNAAAANARAGQTVIPEVLTVGGSAGSRSVTARFLRNDGRDQGYLVYGLPTPRSAAGIEFSGTGVGAVIAGDDPPEFTGGENTSQTGQILVANARARLADMQVITGDSFTVRLATQAVTLPGGFRDRHADGDVAMLRINEGLDLNGNGRVDVVAPGDVSYGFEAFTTTSRPGFFQANGAGLFEQQIDASILPEGMNFLTVRAYRHRNPATGGDGGPAVYSDFKQVLYVDRLPPESAVQEFRSFAGGVGNNDIWIRSTDGTAETVHVFQNLAATVPESTILAWANSGLGRTDQLDGDLFKTGFFGVPKGNNVYTVVTREITGRTNIQRFTGLVPDSARGAGFGDLNFDGSRTATDITGGSGSFEAVLFSKNSLFSAAADVTGDGLVDTRDLLALEPFVAGTAAASALAGVRVRRTDFSFDGRADETDLAILRTRVGLPATGDDLWRWDLDVDGAVTSADVTLLQQGFGVAPTAGVPTTLTWSGDDGQAGGPGTWSTSGLAWRGGVTNATLPMPLVPGSTAAFRGNGSSVTVAGSVRAFGGIDVSGSGTTTIQGGSIDLGDASAAGRIAVAAGLETSISSELVGTGGLVKAGGGRLTLSGVNRVSGDTRIEAGTLAITAAAAAPTGRLSLTAGRFIVDSPSVELLTLAALDLDLAAGASLDVGSSRLSIAGDGTTETALRTALQAGRNGGDWNGGTGIGTSATVAGTRAVGYARDGTGFVVAFAASGDANLDGSVDVFDLVQINTGNAYGGSAGGTWSNGDFDYDGRTTVFDLVAVQTAGQYGAGHYLPAASASLAGGVATVPEPAAGLVLAGGLAGILTACRRRASRQP